MPHSSNDGGLFEAQFDAVRDIAGAHEASKTLIVASTPRSGSHMLGHLMAETGAMGVPYEYGNPRNMPRWRKITGTGSVEDTLGAIMARRTTPNGVFAIKLHYAHLAPCGGLDRLLELFPDPRVIHIHRADLLRQAISLSRARQTDVWIDGMAGNGRRAVYDRAGIEEGLRQLALYNAEWRLDLAERKIPFMAVEFDRVRKEPGGVIREIAAFADIDLDPARIPEKLATKAQSEGGGTGEMIRRLAAEERVRSRAPLYRRALRRLRGR